MGVCLSSRPDAYLTPQATASVHTSPLESQKISSTPILTSPNSTPATPEPHPSNSPTKAIVPNSSTKPEPLLPSFEPAGSPSPHNTSSAVLDIDANVYAAIPREDATLFVRHGGLETSISDAGVVPAPPAEQHSPVTSPQPTCSIPSVQSSAQGVLNGQALLQGSQELETFGLQGSNELWRNRYADSEVAGLESSNMLDLDMLQKRNDNGQSKNASSYQHPLGTDAPVSAIAPLGDQDLTHADAANELARIPDRQLLHIQPQPWHLAGCFASMQPPGPGDSQGTQHWMKSMCEDPRVLALDKSALAYKYGKWFMDTYTINPMSCIGIGSTATVCAGTMNGQKMAFKIMNQTKTAQNAVLMLERSVLTELEVHQGLLKWRDHPSFVNLLGIADCIMFPPFFPVYSIVEGESQQQNHCRSFENDGGNVDMMTGKQAAEDPAAKQSRMSTFEHLKFQIIMVTPLCELGGFLKLCKGDTKLPTRTMSPECLRDVMNGLQPEHYKSLLQPVRPEVVSMSPEDVLAMFPPESMAHDLMASWGRGHRAFMRAGDLSPAWTAVLKLQILLQVADGLALLHEGGVVHCDVKLDNIFLAYDPDARPFRISSKLGDLGMCRYMATDTSRPVATPGLVSTYTTLVKGTPGYCAPEMLEVGRVATATDMYSMSVLCSLALSTSSKFVRHDSSVLTLQTTFPDEMCPSLREVLFRGMSFDALKRPTLNQLSCAMEEELGRVASTIKDFSSMSADQDFDLDDDPTSWDQTATSDSAAADTPEVSV